MRKTCQKRSALAPMASGCKRIWRAYLRAYPRVVNDLAIATDVCCFDYPLSFPPHPLRQPHPNAIL